MLLLPQELAKLKTWRDPARGGEQGGMWGPVSLGDEGAGPPCGLVPARVHEQTGQ